jgi:hypothetical protein
MRLISFLELTYMGFDDGEGEGNPLTFKLILEPS